LPGTKINRRCDIDATQSGDPILIPGRFDSAPPNHSAAAVNQDAYCPEAKASPRTYRALQERLNAAAASALSNMIKSLFWHLRPDAEKFAAPARNNRPSASMPITQMGLVRFRSAAD
jgi:hypothetical protein